MKYYTTPISPKVSSTCKFQNFLSNNIFLKKDSINIFLTIYLMLFFGSHPECDFTLIR